MLLLILEALIKKEPLTIIELSAAIQKDPQDILRCLHSESEAWWYVEAFAGTDGWLYRARSVQAGYVPRVMMSAGVEA